MWLQECLTPLFSLLASTAVGATTGKKQIGFENNFVACSCVDRASQLTDGMMLNLVGGNRKDTEPYYKGKGSTTTSSTKA